MCVCVYRKLECIPGEQTASLRMWDPERSDQEVTLTDEEWGQIYSQHYAMVFPEDARTPSRTPQKWSPATPTTPSYKRGNPDQYQRNSASPNQGRAVVSNLFASPVKKTRYEETDTFPAFQYQLIERDTGKLYYSADRPSLNKTSAFKRGYELCENHHLYRVSAKKVTIPALPKHQLLQYCHDFVVFTNVETLVKQACAPCRNDTRSDFDYVSREHLPGCSELYSPRSRMVCASRYYKEALERTRFEDVQRLFDIVISHLDLDWVIDFSTLLLKIRSTATVGRFNQLSEDYKDLFKLLINREDITLKFQEELLSPEVEASLMMDLGDCMITNV